ncbi:MAG: hypothetical protein ACRD2L_04770, partial [Terriglobia bacterium]
PEGGYTNSCFSPVDRGYGSAFKGEGRERDGNREKKKKEKEDVEALGQTNRSGFQLPEVPNALSCVGSGSEVASQAVEEFKKGSTNRMAANIWGGWARGAAIGTYLKIARDRLTSGAAGGTVGFVGGILAGLGIEYLGERVVRTRVFLTEFGSCLSNSTIPRQAN